MFLFSWSLAMWIFATKLMIVEIIVLTQTHMYFYSRRSWNLQPGLSLS